MRRLLDVGVLKDRKHVIVTRLKSGGPAGRDLVAKDRGGCNLLQPTYTSLSPFPSWDPVSGRHNLMDFSPLVDFGHCR